ncbi:RluA family pseudouridine synthase [Limosilactobacillus sp.]|uniref:RluA family pseudouridine synthase n=1 Tax=Limosilactobacillus sp. TaxID=2773925 RepID=UPI00345EDFE7
MKVRWTIDEQLSQQQQQITLRDLLQKQWLLPRRFVHFLRIGRRVLLNDHYQSMNAVVHPGDHVQLNFLGNEFRTATSSYVPSTDPRLNILYENRDLLVVNKPAGQKSHPNYDGEPGTLMNDVAGYLKQSSSSSAAYMVHRLDQQTSGAMIVAKNPVVVPILDRLISSGQIHRYYLAIVEGSLSPDSGRFSWPIGRDPEDKRKRMVDGTHAQHALTNYQVLSLGTRASLVKLRLATGRTHQIRVHLAHSGHPLVGDPLYNPASPVKRLMLHGYALRLVLPFSMQTLAIHAPTPRFFKQKLIDFDLENRTQ